MSVAAWVLFTAGREAIFMFAIKIADDAAAKDGIVLN
jgi:hypothetical protein